MPELEKLLKKGREADSHRSWHHIIVDATVWDEAVAGLAGGYWSLSGLWGEPGMVHMALRTADINAVLSLECADNHFPSVGRLHPPAIRLERSLRDLYGLVPDDAHDTRNWLDHGRWGMRWPCAGSVHDDGKGDRYDFLPVSGEGIHQIAVGPVHAGVIEPGHFRFNVNGEVVVRLEERFGYTHKGIEKLLHGASLEEGARIAGRICGDSTVAYTFAYVRAVEEAIGLDVPPRAVWLRALMAELERLGNHLGDIGAVCNDAAFALMHAECAILRENVLRVDGEVFGHRLMMDRIVPGGVAANINEKDVGRLRHLVEDIRRRFNPLIELYDNTVSLQDRTVGAGVVPPSLVQLYAPGGYVGRASGRAVDARLEPGYEPYQHLDFTIPVLEDGDVNARIWIRIKEVEQTLSLIGQILDRLPEGGIRNDASGMKAGEGEGLSLTEGFRGDVLVWVKIGRDGHLERGHFRDPSWFQWPLLEAAIKDNIVADFPLCNKSFNCAYSGVDL